MSQPIRILALDDEEGPRLCMELTLSEAGYEVVPVADPAVVLGMLRSSSFDLLITDRTMPGLTGDELAFAVRAHFPTLPIIMLTGTGSEMVAEGKKPFGVTTVLGKPLRKEELLQAVQELAGGTPVVEPAALRILCVDDDKNVLRLTKVFLEREGHEVQAVTDPLKAIELIRQEYFDLVITDYDMPECTGEAVAAAAKEADPARPVIMMSGSVVEGQMPAGVDRLLRKPFKRMELLGVVSELAARR